ncbi:MAG: hypothetical protein PHS54_07200 [Clostridia bacterium]|jgi:hypothetical protein|nr:hypothetical protein [Clostridia bacterium]
MFTELSREEITEIIESLEGLTLKPGVNNKTGNIFYKIYFKKTEDEFNENPHEVFIEIDPLKEYNEGFDSSIITKKCDCKGFVMRKGEIDCKHIRKAIKLIKLFK